MSERPVGDALGSSGHRSVALQNRDVALKGNDIVREFRTGSKIATGIARQKGESAKPSREGLKWLLEGWVSGLNHRS